MIILVVLALKKAGYLQFVNEEHYHIMGKLLFAFSIFWGYIGYSQYMLIWYANIPEETEWFLRRNIESWNALNTFLVIGRFFIPFFYLLFQYTKRNPKFLARDLLLGVGNAHFGYLHHHHAVRSPAGIRIEHSGSTEPARDRLSFGHYFYPASQRCLAFPGPGSTAA